MKRRAVSLQLLLTNFLYVQIMHMHCCHRGLVAVDLIYLAAYENADVACCDD